MQRACGHIKRSRVDAHLAALTGCGGGQFWEAHVVTDAEANAGKF